MSGKEAMGDMTDDTRKLLTEFLGECWHEYIPNDCYWTCRCGHQEYYKKYGDKHTKAANKQGHPFSTYADLHALHQLIWDKHQFRDFCNFAIDTYYCEYNKDHSGLAETQAIVTWLLCLDGNHERGCQLVADWINRGSWV